MASSDHEARPIFDEKTEGERRVMFDEDFLPGSCDPLCLRRLDLPMIRHNAVLNAEPCVHERAGMGGSDGVAIAVDDITQVAKAKYGGRPSVGIENGDTAVIKQFCIVVIKLIKSVEPDIVCFT